MIKAVAVSAILATLTVTAATQAKDILDQLAPQAASTVSDVNLRTVYEMSLQQSYLQDKPLKDVLPGVVSDLGTEGILYTVSEDGSTIEARTDWSCRRAVVGDTWVHISNC